MDELLAADQLEFESIMKATREASCHGNALAEPSRRVNTYAPSTESTRRFVPKLTDSKKNLLKDNEGCFKCCRFFVSHRSKDCPNKFPEPGNYKTLTIKDVDAAKRTRKGKAVAAVTINDDNSDDKPGPSSANPVAVVLGQSVNPVAYIPSNDSNVIGDGSDSDSDVSTPIAVLAKVSNPQPTPNAPDGGNTAPFHVPHLYWQCVTDGKANSFPITINALLDHGSHAVFISEQLADSLGLRRRQLPSPETVEMAMNTGMGTPVHVPTL